MPGTLPGQHQILLSVTFFCLDSWWTLHTDMGVARPGHGRPSSWTGGNNTGEGTAARADSPPPSLYRPLSISPPADSAALGLYCYRGWGQPGASSPGGCRVAP